MDQLCTELHIPRKHISNSTSKHEHRFTVLAHRTWLAALTVVESDVGTPKTPTAADTDASIAAQRCTFPEFRSLSTLRTDADVEWPTNDDNWQTIDISVHTKHSRHVIPLDKTATQIYNNNNNDADQPLGFSGLLQSISQSNHQHLWRAAYDTYEASRPKKPQSSATEATATTTRNASVSSSLLVPYETVLREALCRLYARPILQLHDANLTNATMTAKTTTLFTSTAASIDAVHPNLYAAHCILETATAFYVIHIDRIATTLLDCITYSPAILGRAYNRPLFLIYQLLQFTRTLHSSGLFLGDLQLTECLLTENLWLRVAIRPEANLLELPTEGTQLKPQPVSGTSAAANFDANAPIIKRHYMPSTTQHSLADYCEMWCYGQLSNFDYLTILNNLSGRRLGAPGSHHIMPWVSDLSASNGTNWRDLKKSKYRLNKGDAQLDQMFAAASGHDAAAVPHHVSDVLSEITYYVYMARRTPRTLLCKHVRPIWVPAEYPASIKRLQQWTPDECIPEFFTDASVFRSLHEDLADLEVPAWASCPEEFVVRHREALESQHVSERLHHWIDLNFGHKLSGVAAVRAKNVCLSLVNEHQTLSDRGIVQLFTVAHPQRRTSAATVSASVWTGREPPRLFSGRCGNAAATAATAAGNRESRRRLTRSSEDLGKDLEEMEERVAAAAERKPVQQIKQQTSPRVFQSPSAARFRSPSVSNAATMTQNCQGSSVAGRRETSMERSTSYHTPPVQRIPNQIQLPCDYNPVAALVAVESVEQFLCKTFHRQAHGQDLLQRADWFHDRATCCGRAEDAEDRAVAGVAGEVDESETAATAAMISQQMNPPNSFTNRLFSDTFDELFLSSAPSKHSKRLLNEQRYNTLLLRNDSLGSGATPLQNRRHADEMLRQRAAEQRNRDLQVLGCVIVEMFAADRLRPLGALTGRLDHVARRSACQTVLAQHPNALPRCVQYPVRVLLQLDEGVEEARISDRGLPPVSAQQLLQPLLAHVLFPFPLHYAKVYTLLAGVVAFDETRRLLRHRCAAAATTGAALDDCVLLSRRIAECKVSAFTAQLDRLLVARAHEQFEAMELLLPHVVELMKDEETAILTAWHLFDGVAVALGPSQTLVQLLQPVLRLFDADASTTGRRTVATALEASGGDSRGIIGGGNVAPASARICRGSNPCSIGSLGLHRSRKTGKLYHHSFLLRLIVRFGLAKFLEHFVTPLVEAVGGCKDLAVPCDHMDSCQSTTARQHQHKQQQHFEQTPSQRSDSNAYNDDNDDEGGSFDLSTNIAAPTHHVLIGHHVMGESGSLDTEEEMFLFDDDAPTAGSSTKSLGSGNGTNEDYDYDANAAIQRIIDQLDPTLDAGSVLDLRLNASLAEECTESTPLVESRAFDIEHEDDEVDETDANDKTSATATLRSPTIAIPTFRRSTELNTIDCEIGSKKSIDSSEFLDQRTTPNASTLQTVTVIPVVTPVSSIQPTAVARNRIAAGRSIQNHQQQSHGIADTSAESLLWLAHRIGPVLTARHLTRNLLKMLTLCYVGQENLLPPPTVTQSKSEPSQTPSIELAAFSCSNGRVVGDRSAAKVLECLAAVSALFGEQFVLRQYLPHCAEIVALCRRSRRCTGTLEAGLVASVQLLKLIVPCLCDRTVMEQLTEQLLGACVHPLIRLLGSGRFVMPGGYLARSVLARKLLDAIYVLAVRIGPEMSKDHLCVPALQRFFLIFDKAYASVMDATDTTMRTTTTMTSALAGLSSGCGGGGSPSASSDDSARRQPATTTAAIQSSQKPAHGHANACHMDAETLRIRAHAHEQICDVFDPSLAHVAYVTYLNYLGEYVMMQCVQNLPLILSLCHAFEQPPPLGADGTSAGSNNPLPISPVMEIPPSLPTMAAYATDSAATVAGDNYTITSANSFGTTVIGNRLQVAEDTNQNNAEQLLLDACTYKFEQINTARHLRGNWLAYWEHECGRSTTSDNTAPFNLKQMRLQTFAGHTGSVKALLVLDNENSFMSASKDRTVKLWSLRSEGDGTKVSPCQFTYAAHRKSVHGLAFVEAVRLTVSCDAGVHLWDPFVGAQVAQLDGHRLAPVSVVRAMPSPSAIVLAGTAEATVRTIDARQMAYVMEWRVGGCGNSSSSGSGGGGGGMLGGSGGGGLGSSSLVGGSSSAGGSVRCMAIAPSGTWVACGLSSGQLVVVDGRTGMVVASWRATDGELLQLMAPNDAQVVSTSLDSSVCVWSSLDGSLLFQMKSPPEPAHCILSGSRSGNGQEIIFGTPANRIGVYERLAPDAGQSLTKLRPETFKGVLTSMALLPLNRMMLVGGDSGVINLIC